MSGKSIGQPQARELALQLMRMKGEGKFALLWKDDQVQDLCRAMKKAFEGRGIVIDQEAADGIADAILEMCPQFRARSSARHGLRSLA